MCAIRMQTSAVSHANGGNFIDTSNRRTRQVSKSSFLRCRTVFAVFSSSLIFDGEQSNSRDTTYRLDCDMMVETENAK